MNRFEPAVTFGWCVSEKGGYAYKPLPKCACSSVKRTLWEVERGLVSLPPLDPAVLHSAEFPLFCPQESFVRLRLQELLVFTVVRNPYLRVLSAYLDKIQRRKEPLIYGPFEKRHGADCRELSFKDFLRLIRRERPEEMDIHWAPASFLAGIGWFRYDYIGKVERIEGLARDVLPRIAAAPMEVSSHRPHKTDAKDSIEKYFDEQAVALADEIYAEDFRNFNYRPGDFVKPQGGPVDLAAINGRVGDFLDRYMEAHRRNSEDGLALAGDLEALGTGSGQPYCYQKAAQLRLDSGELDGAEKAQRQAVRLEPDAPLPHVQLSHILAKKEALEEAKKEAHTALELQPASTHALHQLANLLQRSGDFAGAGEAYRRAIALDPAIPGLHAQLSRMLARQGDLEQALQEIQAALALQDDAPGMHQHHGNLLLRLGRPQAAEKALKIALQIDPHIPGAHLQLSRALARQGKLPEAITQAKTALTLTPDARGVKQHLAKLLLRADTE